ncbi:gliding motility-associated C-terminal domain-containing protein [Marinilabiliaceae bacterium JC017]|nr:gliding motility-associated C-terminal domain-containing protein [Marinilabiliaceae bacterium JC017]
MRRFVLVISLLIFFTGLETYAQVGKEFWFVAPEVTSDHSDKPVVLRITAFDKLANVTISMPANAGFTLDPVQVEANTQKTITLKHEDIENKPSGKVNDKGLYITSDENISAYYEVVGANGDGDAVNPDIFTLKGDNALGTEFYIPSQNTLRNVDFLRPKATEKVDIVATEDNTTVTVVPSVNVFFDKAYRAANKPFVITFEKRGQTCCLEYPFQSYSASMGGTHLQSDKPIAVTISDDSVQNPVTGGGYDLIGDQLVPVDLLGKEYIAIRSLGYWDVNRVFIMSTQDDTEVWVGNEAAKSLAKAGDMISVPIGRDQSAVYIKASKPVYVYEVVGLNTEFGSALLPQITCTGSKSVSFCSTNKYSYYIQILTKGKNRESFRLIDQKENKEIGLGNLNWKKIKDGVSGSEDDAWYTAVKDLNGIVTNGKSYTLVNSKGLFHLGVVDVNNGSLSYGYFSSYSNLTIDGLTQKCVGDEIELTAQVPSLGFGAHKFSWYADKDPNKLLSKKSILKVKESGKYWVVDDLLGECELKAAIDVEFTQPEIDLHDMDKCPGNVDLQGPDAMNTYDWTDRVGSAVRATSSEQQFPVDVNPNESHEVELTVTDVKGCTNNKAIKITAKPVPDISLTDISKGLCAGSRIENESHQPGYKYEWVVDGSKVNQDESQKYVQVTKPGKYPVEVTCWIDKGCPVTKTIDVEVFALPEVNLSDERGCPGVPKRIEGPAGMKEYTWKIDGFPVSDKSFIDLAEPAKITLKVEDQHGCMGSGDLDYKCFKKTDFSVHDQKVCPNTEVVIKAEVSVDGKPVMGTGYRWYKEIKGVRDEIDGENTQELLLKANEKNIAGKYIVTADDGNECPMEAFMNVSVKKLPEISIEDKGFCAGDEVPLLNTDESQELKNMALENFHWTRDGDAGYHENGLEIKAGFDDDYHLQATMVDVDPKLRCAVTGDLKITALPLPEIIFDKDEIEICPDKESYTLKVKNADADIEYAWRIKDTGDEIGDKASIDINIGKFEKSEETYTLMATDKKGCFSEKDITLKLKALPLFVVKGMSNMCEGDPLTIRVQDDAGVSGYVWYHNDMSNEMGSLKGKKEYTIPSVQKKDAGKYIVTAQGKGCKLQDEVELTVFDNPPLSMKDGDEVCEGDILKIEGDNNFTTFEWSIEGQPGTISTDPTFEILEKDAGDKTYKLTATTNHGCINYAEVNVTVYAAPDVMLDKPQPVFCPGTWDIGFKIPLVKSRIESIKWNEDDIDVGARVVPVSKEGNYELVITDEHGCTATDALDVVYHKPAAFSLGKDKDVCSNASVTLKTAEDQLGYSWSYEKDGKVTPLVGDENTFTVTDVKAGKYTVTVTDKATKCKVNTSVDLSVKPVMDFTLGNDEDICQGDEFKIAGPPTGFNAYEWHKIGDATFQRFSQDIVVSTPGVYQLTATMPNGCKNSDEVEVRTWAPPMVDLGDDRQVCPGPIEVAIADSAIVSPRTFDSFRWSTGETTNYSNEKITVNEPGTYYLEAKDDIGCKVSDKITFTPYELPKIDLGEQVSYCENTTYTLELPKSIESQIEHYQWERVDEKGVTFDGPVDGPWSVFNETGTYTLKVVDKNKCSSSGSVPVILKSAPVFNLGPDVAMCKGDTVKVLGNTDFSTYQWNDNPADNKSFKIVDESGIYKLSVWNEDMCRTDDEVVITANALPEVDLGPDFSNCVGDFSTLSVDPVYESIRWSTGETTPEIEVGKGKFTVTVTDANHCSNSDDILISRFPVPQVELGEDEVACPLQPIQLDAGTGFESYLWQNGSTDQRIMANFSDTVNMVTVKDKNGCYGWDTKVVYGYEAPPYTLGPDTEICSLDSIILDAGPDYLEYHWNDKWDQQHKTIKEKGEYWVEVTDGCFLLRDTINIDVKPSPVITRIDTIIYGQIGIVATEGTMPFRYSYNDEFPQDENLFKDLPNGTYHLLVEDVNGCCARDTVVLFSEYNVEVPNFFTPNGDGINDTWELKGMEKFPESIVRIYDRYGKLLAEFMPAEESWDGEYQNKPVPSDDYWYIIHVKPINKLVKGHISIKR